MSIIGGIVVSIMFFASIAYIETQAKSMASTSNKSDRRIVMDGLYSYTVNAIKQSWCLSSTWVQELNCNLNHPRYTQRLLLSDEALLFIRNSGTARPPDPLTNTRLASFGTTVTLSALTESHPLYSIVQPLKNEYEYAKFTVERDASAISAVRGREVPIKITVFLKHKSNVDLDQTLVSKNIVYPRELSYFGLVLSNNLYLATGTNDASKGWVRLETQTVSANAGLRFESPVYINGDLNLPNSSFRPAMNNVIFVDKVVLGGQVKMDDKPYIVKTAGGDGYMFNYNMPNFAGIMGGFERDPARDTGLDYLFNIVAGGETSFDAQKLCRERLMSSYDLTLTDAAQLWVSAAASGSNTATLKYNLGNVDNFIEQDLDGFKSLTTVTGIDSAAQFSGIVGTPVMKARVYYNGLKTPDGKRGAHSTEFYIPRQGTVTLYPTGTANPGITISASPLVVGGRNQYNQVNLSFNFGAIDIAPYIAGSGTINSAPSIKFVFEAYDYGYLNGNNLRTPGLPFYRKLNGVTFSKSGSAIVLSSTTSDSIGLNNWVTNSGLLASGSYPYDTTVDYIKRHKPADTDQNLAEFDDQCFATPEPTDPNADFSAFPAATWDTSFAKQARNAWSFDTDFKNYDPPGYKNDGMAYNLANDTEFHIDSLVSTCTVGANQTLLAGMFTCERFVIQARSLPLRIIGTVITNQLQIDPTAYKAGIRWSSIYHPQAVQELINAKVLGRDKANKLIDCKNAALAPLWQSNIGITDRYTHYVCNPVSLRRADPFKWSTVDPDCGLQTVKTSTSVKCKKQTTRFLIKEISRGKGL
jgi:hypothetical protein